MSDEERVALVGEAEACGADLASLPLAERWIVSRLHATEDHVTVGPAGYCPRHVIDTQSPNPRFLSSMASCALASNICPPHCPQHHAHAFSTLVN